MMLAFWFLGTVSLLELLLWLPLVWPIRKWYAAVTLVLLASASSAFATVRPNAFTLIIFILSLYRMFNLLRVVKGRMHPKYLYRVTSRTSVALICWQLFFLVVWSGYHWLSPSGYAALLALNSAALLLAAVVFGSLLRHLQTTGLKPALSQIPSQRLPTLTVAIPARNETEDLEVCLRALVASDYPKLEILVLDDCSVVKRTPEIIRDFAQDGVRFLAGKPLNENWLAKNQAYQQLLEASSGEYILFCGVDVRLAPDSLRQLVNAMLEQQKSMLCLIPRNALQGSPLSWRPLFLQPVRYAWELILPRKLFRRPPPVLSTCWLVSRQLVSSAGGFAAVSRSIVPESYFARVSNRQHGYSFVRPTDNSSIISEKPLHEQRATAIRTRYPQLHRRPEQVALLMLLEVLGMLLPFVSFVASFFIERARSVMVLSGLACLLLVVCYSAVVKLTYRRFLLRSLVALPFAVLVDLALLHFSMAKYEFSEVLWKGRNVCIPVMHAIPKLPKV